MNTLFPLEPNLPEGFYYHPGFLNKDEEAELCKQILKLDLQNMNYHGYKANRKTVSFGYDYNFDDNKLSKEKLFLLHLILSLKKLQRIFRLKKTGLQNCW